MKENKTSIKTAEEILAKYKSRRLMPLVAGGDNNPSKYYTKEDVLKAINTALELKPLPIEGGETVTDEDKLNKLLEPLVVSYWESHSFENALTEEGEYIELSDVYRVVKEYANFILATYEAELSLNNHNSKSWKTIALECEARIVELQADISEMTRNRDHLKSSFNEAERELHKQDEQITALQSQLSEKDKEIERMKVAINEQNLKVLGHLTDKAELKSQLSNMAEALNGKLKHDSNCSVVQYGGIHDKCFCGYDNLQKLIFTYTKNK